MSMRIGGGNPVGGGGLPSDGDRHTVQKGETLQSIADQYGVSKDALAMSNQHLKNPEKLRAGTRLNLPAAASRQSDGSVVPASKDSFESAPQKSELDKMMEPARTAGESKAFNFGKEQIPSGEWKAWGDPHVETKASQAPSGESKAFNFGKGETAGESRAFNFGKEQIASGETKAKGDPHVETNASSAVSGESKAFNFGKTEPAKSGEEQAFTEWNRPGVSANESQASDQAADGSVRPADGSVKKLDANQFEIKDGKVIIKGE